jgi:endoglucanase
MKHFILLSVLVLGYFSSYSFGALRYVGVNEACAEFGTNLPGVYDTDYTYPKTASIDYFLAKGMNSIRIPFRWERIQRTLNADFDAAELTRLNATVDYITKTKGAVAVLDVHNYARYGQTLVGTSEVPDSAFADFWKRLALVFKGNEKVLFGLVNEPFGLPGEQWLRSANAAIAAIRSVGANNLILVPGVAWSGAHSWMLNWYGTSNSVVMKGVVDPMNNYAIEVHQYFDTDSSGQSTTCMSETIGVERVSAFTAWCKENNLTAYLGEFASGANPTCGAAVDKLLKYMEENSDVWIGWAWWAAGPWWGESYVSTIEPSPTGEDKPQLSYLLNHV